MVQNNSGFHSQYQSFICTGYKSDIVGDAMECITQEDISHKNIVFEVTESGELENNPMVRNVLRSLNFSASNLRLMISAQDILIFDIYVI